MKFKPHIGLILQRKEAKYYLTDLAKVIPGGRDRKTIFNWCTKGLLLDRFNAKSGRVRMESILLTNGHASSLEAYWRFIERISQQ